MTHLSTRTLLTSLIVALSLRLTLSLTSPSLLSIPSHQYTPITQSLSSLHEALYIQKHTHSAYESPVTYQLPLVLALFSLIPQNLTYLVTIIIDTFTAFILLKFTRILLASSPPSHQKLANLLFFVYLFNPLQIASAAAGSLISLRNFALAVLLWQTVKVSQSSSPHAAARLSMFYMALLVYLDWNYVILLGGIILLAKNGVDDYFGGRGRKGRALGVGFVIEMLVWFLVWLGILVLASYYAAGHSWQWIDHVYGRIFRVEDLSPNWGNYWYFFTEVFDHFRKYFLLVFNGHIYAYVIPLLLKFHKQPVFLTVIQIAILSVFSAYPSFGGIFFALTLLLLYVHLTKYTRYTFVLMLICLYTSVSGPAFFTTWIYTGTGNANFFYFMTLGFVLSQVMLIVEAVLGMLRWQVDVKRQDRAEIKQE